MTEKYDLFVIGAGSGGVRAARIAARHGAKVGIAESGPFGGTCVNAGCVPKKLMVYASEFSRHFEDARNYGWSTGVCILITPHEGVPAMLSPGTFGHGGAWGTQAWIDPVKRVAYLLFVQRSNFGNSDASEVRRAFQQAAADALAKKT